MTSENKQIVGPFASRMRNTCSECAQTIQKYSPIYYHKQRRTKEEIASGINVKGPIAVHQKCIEPWLEKNEGWKTIKPGFKNPELVAEEPLNTQHPVYSVEQVSEPITREEQEIVPTQTTQGTSDLLGLIASSVLPLVQSQLQTKVNQSEVKTIVEQVTQTMIDKALKTIEMPVKIIQLLNPITQETVNLGLQHKQFEDLLLASQARLDDGHRLNVWLGGPAGSGKSKAGEYVAQALGLEFAYCGSFNEAHKVFGFMSPIDGKYHTTPFREAYEKGKCFMFDDFDGSDPVCVVELLGMLANGHAAFPDGMVKRHPDFLALISANTFGHGATQDYVGRMKQDKALLNRFIVFNWLIDEQLEMATSNNKEWCKRVQEVRKNVEKKGLKVLVTPRQTYFGAALLRAGFSQDKVEGMCFANAMSEVDWNAVRF